MATMRALSLLLLVALTGTWALGDDDSSTDQGQEEAQSSSGSPNPDQIGDVVQSALEKNEHPGSWREFAWKQNTDLYVEKKDLSMYSKQLVVLVNLLSEDLRLLNHIRAADQTLYKKKFLNEKYLDDVVKGVALKAAEHVAPVEDVLKFANKVHGAIKTMKSLFGDQESRLEKILEDWGNAPCLFHEDFSLGQLAVAWDTFYQLLKDGGEEGFAHKLSGVVSGVSSGTASKVNDFNESAAGTGTRVAFHVIMTALDVISHGLFVPVHVKLTALDQAQRSAASFIANTEKTYQLQAYLWALYKFEAALRASSQTPKSAKPGDFLSDDYADEVQQTAKLERKLSPSDVQGQSHLRYKPCSIAVDEGVHASSTRMDAFTCGEGHWCMREFAFFPTDDYKFQLQPLQRFGLCVPHLLYVDGIENGETTSKLLTYGKKCMSDNSCRSGFCQYDDVEGINFLNGTRREDSSSFKDRLIGWTDSPITEMSYENQKQFFVGRCAYVERSGNKGFQERVKRRLTRRNSSAFSNGRIEYSKRMRLPQGHSHLVRSGSQVVLSHLDAQEDPNLKAKYRYSQYLNPGADPFNLRSADDSE